MSLLAIPFPGIDPVAIQIGPVAIKWYGLAYLAGLVLGWIYVRRLLDEARLWPGAARPFSAEKTDDLLLFMTIGVVIGGRLGFVLFYEPSTFWANPWEIPRLDRGGMAFHGALVGCGLAIWLFSKRADVRFWSATDVCSAAVPIGLFFGRIANFINGELYGRPSSVAWAMVFPGAAQWHPDIEPTPRHPSQLYEAFFEGLVLFLVLRVLTHYRGALKTPGIVTGAFLLGYGLARSFCEMFREPHEGHVLNIGPLTPGIAYSMPMILLGLYIIWIARNRTADEHGTA